MGLERSLRRSDQPCGQHHRSIVRSAILLALVVVALTSQLALLKYNECSDIQQTARSFQVTPNSQPLSEQSSLSLAHQLPLTHRVASSSTCIDSRSHRYAPASWEPRVSLEHQRQFALGKYNLIAKGSGEINACGPLISYLSHIQHSEGIFGTLAEFGVHHGRFTGFLFTTARATEKLVVGDLFAQQDKNVDKSGLGDKKMFLRSLETYGMMPRDLHALIEASTDELPFDLNRKAKAEPFRMISVDASHTAAFTFNDLQLAFCNLLQGGIVVLDDWFHSAWPGVVEGFFQFVHHQRLLAADATTGEPVPHVYPFLVCESKLFLTNDWHMYQRYYDALRNATTLENILTPYAHEKERGKLEYEMLGTKYLKCSSRNGMMPVEEIQKIWATLVY